MLYCLVDSNLLPILKYNPSRIYPMTNTNFSKKGTDALLAKTSTSSIPEPKTEKPNLPEAQDAKEAQYQHYKSSRPSMRMITTEGKNISFTGYEFLTQDEDIIEYLDYELSKGLPGITKGELMTLSDKDPMEALKRKIIKEYEDKKAKEASDKSRGVTKESRVNPLSSDNTAN